MRQLITFLLMGVCSIGLLEAQTSDGYEKIPPQQWQKIKSQFQSEIQNQGNSQSKLKAPVDQFLINYDSIDARYAANNGFNYRRFFAPVNKNYTPQDGGNLAWGAQVYDSLYNLASNTGYNKENYTIQIDTILLPFIHDNITGNTDTIVASIWLNSTLSLSGNQFPTELNGQAFWRDTLTTSSPLAPGQQGDVLQFAIDSLLPYKGESFTFRVGFIGDTVNTFRIFAGSRDKCNGSCGANPARIQQSFLSDPIASTNTNSFKFVYFEQQGTNVSGINLLGFPPSACTGTDTCEQSLIQNFRFFPLVTLRDDTLQADPFASSDTVCPGQQIQLNAGAKYGRRPLNFSWTPSSAFSNPNARRPTITASSGSNTYEVVVTDGDGFSDTASVTVVGANGISVDAGNDTTSLGCNSTIDLTATPSGSTNGVTYQWFGGGNPPTAATYSGIDQPGMYRVKVENNAGCTGRDTVVVEIPGINQNVNFTNPTPICAGDQFTFTNTSNSQSGWNFDWSFGDGNTSTSTSPTHSYSNGGTYQVQVTADSAGCTFSESDSVEVIGNSVSFNIPSSVCPNDQFNLSNTSSNTSNWNFTWTLDDGSGTKNGTNISHTYSSGGTYDIELQASRSGCTYSTTNTVNVPDDPNVDFTAPDTVKENNSVSFTNTSGSLSGYTFTWEFGDGNTSQGNNATHTYSDNATGLQTVTLTAENMGCSFQTQKNIFVEDIVGIADRGFNDDLTVFPNPTTGGLTVNIQNAEYDNLDIAVYNLQGEAVYSDQVDKTDGQVQLQLDLSDLSNGMYLLKLQSADKLATQKITLNK